MLILTRKPAETLMIGDDISLTVLSVKGNQVRIGIEAPKEVNVHREEIFERIQNERAEEVRTEDGPPPTQEGDQDREEK